MLNRDLLLLAVLSPQLAATGSLPGLPMVINTWGGPFTVATDAAYQSLTSGGSALDAVESGCSACEKAQCDGTVGPGGSPDEMCETTLDAMIMDGNTLASGAVAALRRVSSAIAVARAVLVHTRHSLLAGDQATEFAFTNGFTESDLSTPASRAACTQWRDQAHCQPNYRLGVVPDPRTSCGPYAPAPGLVRLRSEQQLRLGYPKSEPGEASLSHDTVSLVAISKSGAMAAGTSTNGAAHKVPGRVGDGAIAGSGAYADSDVGGCGATGDGDIMMRFLPCYQAVESLRRGMGVQAAAEDAVWRMLRRYPDLQSGIVVVDKGGNHAGAASGWDFFTYAYRAAEMNSTVVVSVPPLAVEAMSLSEGIRY